MGVQLPEAERVVRWPELREMAQTAEEIGLDSLWVGDHLLYRYPGEEPRGPWEAWSQLAALAAITTRVQLGPLVAATSFHNPAMLAKKAATIDDISGGRLILGLGAGWNRAEYEAFGFPYDRRVSRFEEAFTIKLPTGMSSGSHTLAVRAVDPARFTSGGIPFWLFGGYSLLTITGLALIGIALRRAAIRPRWDGGLVNDAFE